MYYDDLVKKLSYDDLGYFITIELPKINISNVSGFIVNPDIKDFLIEYLWEVAAPDHYIKKIEKSKISSRRLYHAYDLLDYEGIYYIVLPSGAVVSWI